MVAGVPCCAVVLWRWDLQVIVSARMQGAPSLQAHAMRPPPPPLTWYLAHTSSSLTCQLTVLLPHRDAVPAALLACRTGEEEEARLQDTHTLTQVPLAVLLNSGSASTAELLAAALHDDRSALLVGERSFGKGRTQRVIDLSDGSTLLVSTMSYKTPAHKVVHKVGLAPDVVCRAQPVGSELWQAGSVAGGSLLDDPCVELAARKLSRQAS